MAGKRRRYTDEERAQLIVMLEVEGYPDKLGALSKVATYAQVSPDVLRRWWKGTQNPPPDNLVVQKKEDMAGALEEVAWKLIEHANKAETVADMSGQQTATSIGIYIDKVRLLRGLPTEIIQIIPDVISAIKSMGLEPSDVFNNIIKQAKQNADSRDSR